MLRRVHLQLFCLTLLPTLASSAQLGSFDHFRCLVSGHWDNVQQAEADATLDKDEQNRHPRRAMTYIPVRNPNLDGQLFAILNYTELGFDGPLQRVSLHRFKWLASERSIVHEFFFLKDAERWGKLGGASPEIFDKVTEAGLQDAARTARIAAVAVSLDCGP